MTIFLLFSVLSWALRGGHWLPYSSGISCVFNKSSINERSLPSWRKRVADILADFRPNSILHTRWLTFSLISGRIRTLEIYLKRASRCRGHLEHGKKARRSARRQMPSVSRDFHKGCWSPIKVFFYLYSRLCLNPYLSVDGPGYGVLGSMCFKSEAKWDSKNHEKNGKKSEKIVDDVFVVKEMLR